MALIFFLVFICLIIALAFFPRSAIVRNTANIIALIFFLVFICLIIASSFPSNSVFEGALTVSRVSFTYNGGAKYSNTKNGKTKSTKRLEQTFLKKALEVEKIVVRGVDNFTLPPGQYKSNNRSFLNSEILEPLKVDFKDSSSIITIKPSDKTTSRLAISRLILEPQTNISRLEYISFNNSLNIALKKDRDSSSGFLSLDLDDRELQIEIDKGYNFPDLGKTGKKLDLKLKPYLLQINDIPLQKKAQLEIVLSKSSKYPSQIEFGNRFSVQNVQLYTKDVKNNTRISSIIDGQIQLPQTDKKLNLVSGQFLLSNASVNNNPEKNILSDSVCIDKAQPNIFMIRNIKTNSKGISFRIVGKSRKIQSGFDPCFPVDWIQVSWLSKFINSELHPALLALFAGAATSLFTWLIGNLRGLFPNSSNER